MKQSHKILGLGLLVWILSTIDFDKTLQALLNLRPNWLLAYFAFFATGVFVRVCRLGVTLNRMGHHWPFARSYVCTIEPTFLGVVTPGRLGEFARAGYLYTRGVPLLEAVALCLLERVIDFGVYFLAGLAGCAYIFCEPSFRLPVSVAILALLPISGFVMLRKQVLPRLTGALSRFALRLLPERHWPRGFASTETIQDVMLRTLGPHLAFSCMGLILGFMQIYCLAEAFSFTADRLMVLYAFPAATLISLLPISFAGLGTRDAAYIFIMGSVGIAREQALLFSLLDGVVVPVVGISLLLLPGWIAGLIGRSSRS